MSRRPDPAGSVGWDAVAREVDGADAVVNLAGAPIGGLHWTARRKQAILSSRVETTRALAGAIAAVPQRPRVCVTASGIDYYGDSGPYQLVDESAPAGGSFLARVCVAWEAAAAGAPGPARRDPHPARHRARRAGGPADRSPVPALRRRPGRGTAGSSSRGCTSTTSSASTGVRSTTISSRARSMPSPPSSSASARRRRVRRGPPPPGDPSGAGVRPAARPRRAGGPAPPRSAGRLPQARRARVPLPGAAGRARGRDRLSLDPPICAGGAPVWTRQAASRPGSGPVGASTRPVRSGSRRQRTGLGPPVPTAPRPDGPAERPAVTHLGGSRLNGATRRSG